MRVALKHLLSFSILFFICTFTPVFAKSKKNNAPEKETITIQSPCKEGYELRVSNETNKAYCVDCLGYETTYDGKDSRCGLPLSETKASPPNCASVKPNEDYKGTNSKLLEPKGLVFNSNFSKMCEPASVIKLDKNPFDNACPKNYQLISPSFSDNTGSNYCVNCLGYSASTTSCSVPVPTLNCAEISPTGDYKGKGVKGDLKNVWPSQKKYLSDLKEYFLKKYKTKFAEEDEFHLKEVKAEILKMRTELSKKKVLTDEEKEALRNMDNAENFALGLVGSFKSESLARSAITSAQEIGASECLVDYKKISAKNENCMTAEDCQCAPGFIPMHGNKNIDWNQYVPKLTKSKKHHFKDNFFSHNFGKMDYCVDALGQNANNLKLYTNLQGNPDFATAQFTELLANDCSKVKAKPGFSGTFAMQGNDGSAGYSAEDGEFFGCPPVNVIKIKVE